jgi:hypothetical protein
MWLLCLLFINTIKAERLVGLVWQSGALGVIIQPGGDNAGIKDSRNKGVGFTKRCLASDPG